MNKKKTEDKWQDIEIKINIRPDKITWNSNVDTLALVFYLQRVIYCINQNLDGGEK